MKNPGLTDYEEHAESGLADFCVKKIPEWKNVAVDTKLEKVFHFHNWVYSNIDYRTRHFEHRENRRLNSPMETLETGKGNCEEQVVLLAMLYKELNVPYQYVELTGEEDGHLSIRVSPHRSERDLTDEISDLCHSTPMVNRIDTAISAKVRGYRFYYCDPEMSMYLGDPQGLRSSEYIEEGSLRFKCSKRAYDPEVGRTYRG